MKKKLKDISDCDHIKFYTTYILTSYPLRHPWTCSKCGGIGIDVGYNVKGLSYEELLEYFPRMNKR